jgi:hypothetical protein
MRHFKPRPLIEYFRTSLGPGNKRRSLRLPLKAPLLYSFVNEHDQFHECLMTDVSRDGICIDLKDLHPNLRKKYLVKDNRIYFKLELPIRRTAAESAATGGPDDDRTVIAMTARIRWTFTPDPDRPEALKAGCEFEGLRMEDRIEIVHYGVRQLRRKRFLQASLAVFAASFLLTIIWLGIATTSEKQALLMLKDSEVDRLSLLAEKENLAQDIEGLRKQLARKRQIPANRGTTASPDPRLRDQSLALKRCDQELKEQEKRIAEADRAIMGKIDVIAQRAKRIDDLTKLLDQKTLLLRSAGEMLGEIGQEWDMGKNEGMIILDQAYADGRKALLGRDYPAASRAFRAVSVKYPDSLLGYRLLYRSLFLAGEKSEADLAFAQLTRQTRKFLERTR